MYVLCFDLRLTQTFHTNPRHTYNAGLAKPPLKLGQGGIIACPRKRFDVVTYPWPKSVLCTHLPPKEGEIRYAIPQANDIRPIIRTILAMPIMTMAAWVYKVTLEPKNEKKYDMP